MVQPANASSNPIVYGLIENVPFSRYSIAVCHNHLAFLGGQIGYLDRITDLFFSAVQWIKEHLLCYYLPQPEIPNYMEIAEDYFKIFEHPLNSTYVTDLEERVFSVFSKILKPHTAEMIQSIETEMRSLQNLSSIPELSEAERAELYDSFSTRAGRTKGEVWDENKDVWNQNVRNLFLDIQPIYEFLKNSGYTKTWQEISDFIDQHPLSDELRDFLANHVSDPQSDWVSSKKSGFISFIRFISSLKRQSLANPSPEGRLNYVEITQDLTRLFIHFDNTDIQQKVFSIFFKILKPHRTEMIQNIETEMRSFQNFSSIPELSEAERAEVYDSSSPHAGRTKGEVWDENKDAWNQNVRNAFLAIQPIYEFFKNSGYTKTEQEISDFMDQHPIPDEIHQFVQNHDSDPQFVLVYPSFQSLVSTLLCISIL